jgi:hypothetical protein
LLPPVVGYGFGVGFGFGLVGSGVGFGLDTGFSFLGGSGTGLFNFSSRYWILHLWFAPLCLL